MQNMEKYFGFRVYVSDFLEPEGYGILRDSISAALERDRTDSSQYRVYLHQLRVEAKTTHFGVGGGLTGRLSKIHLRFSVNQKQCRSGDIRFMNYRFDSELHERVGHYYFANEVGYTLNADYFGEERQFFQNTLVTLVRVDMREQHKKIKVRVAVDPNPDYLLRLADRHSADAETQFALDFKKAVVFSRQTPLNLTSGSEGKKVPNKPEKQVSQTTIIASTIGTIVKDSQNVTVNSSQNILENPTLLEHLLKDLRQLQDSIQQRPPSGAPAEDLGVVAGVVAEANLNPRALERLRTVGKWIVTRAEQVGLNLLSEFLKGQIGL